MEPVAPTEDTAPMEPVAPPEPPAPTQKTETHKIAGVSFRQEGIQSLAAENADYSKTKKELIEDGLTDEWVNQYDFYLGEVELVPEPDNPQDSKAIKVVASGQHIGYIKSGSCAHIHKLLRSGKILMLTCEIGGGRGKIVREDENEWGKVCYSVEQRNIPFFAKLEITVQL
jgi:hypothetical protein